MYGLVVSLQAETQRLLVEMLAVLVVAHRLGTPEDRQAADRLQRRLLHDDLQVGRSAVY